MKIIEVLITAATLVCISCCVNAQDRPKIGLVLSGGGARGAAHVGVLKVLEELQVPIDLITGTSMGSVVGGLYASGMSAAEIEIALREMDWDEALSDAQSREYLSLNRKRQQDLFTTNLNLGFSDGQVKFPSGAIQGQNIDLALQRLTTHVIHITDFDNLKIPFRAVATDLAKGEVVVLDSGNLAEALRASMSVPSLFAPVTLDGRILVDGGVTNNLPVDIARQMGAEVVIVIDISTPLRDGTELDSLLAVTDQLTRLLTGLNTRQSRENLSENDILLIPDLGDITSSQFERSDEAIAFGEIEARTNIQDLSRFSVSDEAYQVYLAGLNTLETPSQSVAMVTVNNNSGLKDAVISDLVSTEARQLLNLDTIENDISQIYGLGFFEKVGYRLSQQPNGIDVNFYATPKSWGPNYLHFGFSMDSDHNGDNDTNITFGYTRSEINSLGAEWTTLFQVGSDPIIYSYFHQPLSLDLSYFVEPYFSGSRINYGLFNTGGDELAEVRVKQTEVGFMMGKEFGSNSILSLGLSRIEGEVEILIGDALFPDTKYKEGGVSLNFNYDSLNSNNFPTSGYLFNANYYKAFENFGASEQFDQWQIESLLVKSSGKHTMLLGVNAGGTEKGFASIPKYFSVGGIFNLSGLRSNQYSGQFLGLVKAAYYRRFNQINFLPAYIGATAEYGGVWENKDDINFDNSILGGSIFIGLDSIVGPMLLGVGLTDGGDSTLYVKVGRLF